MARLALVLAGVALAAALVVTPGPYVAMGCGIGAVGLGRVAYARRANPGASRLAGAGAMTLGALGLLLGAARVAIMLAALGRLDALVR